eukprot:TRINITY_DN183_c0_g1_i1.p1 TRINITY_DN183_c0_g1~~TRINITY_DN183_c0_g1_i1.p1  ORF type:complete len:164 (-),score=24.20 TRINITY_DN183_c0_g1_i1:335-826(-)
MAKGSDSVQFVETYDTLFAELAERFRSEGWEARLEDPPQAYIHFSKPTWGDERMNGIHLETYVLQHQLASGRVPVALHCERGCPFQKEFLAHFTARARSEIESWPVDVEILGDKEGSSSVCEISVPMAAEKKDTVERLVVELRRLQTLSPLIDEVIQECRQGL